jgi:hypothetical protein
VTGFVLGRFEGYQRPTAVRSVKNQIQSLTVRSNMTLRSNRDVASGDEHDGESTRREPRSPKYQYASDETTSPLLGVIRHRWTTMFKLSLRNRTEPSPSSAVTPPGWKPKISSFAPALLPAVVFVVGYCVASWLGVPWRLRGDRLWRLRGDRLCSWFSEKMSGTVVWFLYEAAAWSECRHEPQLSGRAILSKG